MTKQAVVLSNETIKDSKLSPGESQRTVQAILISGAGTVLHTSTRTMNLDHTVSLAESSVFLPGVRIGDESALISEATAAASAAAATPAKAPAKAQPPAQS